MTKPFGKQLAERIERSVDEGKRDANRLSRTQVFQQYDACLPLLKWQTEAEGKVIERQREEQVKAWQRQQEEQQRAWQQQAIAAQEKAKQERLDQEAERRREAAEEQAIVDTRTQLQRCWRPVNLMNNVPITFIVDMNQDGTVAKAVVQEAKDNKWEVPRRSQIPGLSAAVNAVYQSLTDRHCQPWPLSKKQYVFSITLGD